MKNNNEIRLNFKIDSNYLIAHTLSSTSGDNFSSIKHKKNIVMFQNYAWKKCQSCYNLLAGRVFAEEVIEGKLQKTTKHIPQFLTELKKSKQYRKIYQQTERYLKFGRNQWNKNYQVSSGAVKKLTGLKLDKKFDVYITHPSLRNGKNRGNNLIEWGHCEDWPNYSTIYLWHEVLHSYLGRSDIEHAVIELITDEELRKLLNGDKYPPFVGHRRLALIKIKLLPLWKKYLKSGSGNIKQFIRKLPATYGK